MHHNIKWLTRAALLLALALVFQSIKLGQFVTGPAVNAVLFIATVMLGPWGAAGIGLLTPFTAFFLGVIKPVLAPAIPFIMLGNVVLALAFGYGRRGNPYLAGVGASVLKFAALAGGVSYLVPLLFRADLPGPVIVALTWPQLLTALGGALVAFLVLEALTAAGIIPPGEWKRLRARSR